MKVKYLESMVIDDEGNKVGRWIDRDYYYVCSACGKEVQVEFDGRQNGSKIKYKFCPLCGAKMD